MNALPEQPLPSRDTLWLPPFDTLDDAGLLAHLAGPRAVRFDAAVDPQEVPPERIAGILEGRFEFNGETHALPDPVDWLANPSADVEWHILLHKFYYAVGLAQAWQDSGDARYARRWATLLDGWMRVVPPGFIAADVTGRRVQHWLYSLRLLVMHGRGAAAVPVAPALLRRVLHSLHEQVEYLCEHLTPKRNHRTLELLAIFLAGVALPELRRAAHWRAFALEQTAANLQADLLPDGVHCELSTDYHCLALRNWLAVRTLAADHGVPVPAGMDQRLGDALHFAVQAQQPGGRMPSFSDGDARSYAPLLVQAARVLGPRPVQRVAHFPQAGYHVLRGGERQQHLMFDCGPLGEGNHGHFDALSFELAAGGRPLVVDPGRYTYSEAGEPNWRLHFRGTAAHNTVCVDGLNQTAYTPRPVKEASRHAAGSVRHKVSGPAPRTTLLEAAHHEVLDLLHGRCESAAYDAVHERTLVFVDQRYWIVADWLHAPTEHQYAASFQLGTDAQGRCQADGRTLRSPGLLLAAAARAGQQAVLAEGWVSEQYGHKQPAPAWRLVQHGAQARFASVLWPCDDPDAAVQVSELAVPGDGALVCQALRIELREGGQVWRDGWFHAGGAVARRWHLGPYALAGRWLHWREDAQGRIVRALSHDGATLLGPQGPLRVQRVRQQEPA